MIYQKKKIPLNFLLVFLIPFLISGPFFPDLIVSFSAIVFLVYVIKEKDFRYFNNKPAVIFFFFCLYCILVSFCVAVDTLFSLKTSLFYFRIGIFSCVIWYVIEQDKKILNYFYFVLVITFSILVIDAFLQFFFKSNLLGWPPKDHGRISSFFGDELIMGSYLSRLFPLLLALFVIRKINKIELYYLYILFILTVGAIFISGERTASFFVILSIIFISILLNIRLKFKIYFIAGLIFIFTALITTNNHLANRFIFDTAKSIGLEKELDKKYIFTKSHDSLIHTAYNMFIDKPFFGHGPKMFRVLCKDKRYAEGINPCSTHPHNFYFQLLAETGIFGFLFLLSALIYVIYCSIRQLKSILLKKKSYLTNYQVCLLACLLITLWPLSPNGNFFNNWLAICYSLPVGFYLHSIYGKNKADLLKE